MSVSVSLTDGDSVIAWQTPDGISFQEFNNGDQPVGTTTTVTSGLTSWLSLVALNNDGFSVVWDANADSAPAAQDYNPNGAASGTLYTPSASPSSAELAFTSRQSLSGSQSDAGPWTALLPDGDTVTVTNSIGSNSQPPSLTMQQYDPSGNPIGSAYVDSIQGLPGLGHVEIAPLANGNYVVGFVDNQNYGGVSYFDLFSSAGVHLANDLVTQTGFELIPDQAVAGLPDGGFAISWVAAQYNTQNIGSPAPYAVFSEEFKADGSVASPAQMLGVLSSSYTAPEIDAFPNGQYTISWTSGGTVESATFTEQSAALTPNLNDAIATPALSYQAPIGIDAVTLIGNAPQIVTANDAGDTIVSNDYASTLIGGTGNDTLIAGHNANIMTGGGGDDTFVFNYLPWNAGQITDFNPGTDKLDLGGSFSTIGYAGTNPVADGYLSFVSDGHGNTLVEINTHDASDPWPILVTTLDGVSPSGVTPEDYGSSDPSPVCGDGSTSGAPSTVDTSAATYVAPAGVTNIALTGMAAQSVTANNAGDTITSNNCDSTLIGGTGNDTLIAGQDANTMTGGGGHDTFVFNFLPWNNSGQITDFNPATDTLDLSGIFQSIDYTGSNPVADGYLSFVSDGNGNTLVEINPHSPSDPWPTVVTTLDGISPSMITPADYGYSGPSVSGGSNSGSVSDSSGSTVDTSAATYVAPTGVTNIVLVGAEAQTVTANNAGDTITSNNSASTLIGGTGNDTLIAGQDANIMTGGGGNDMFVFNALPWNNSGEITDFNPNTDVLNLTGIFTAIGYTGANPIADGTLSFVSDGNGNTIVEVNSHNPSAPWPTVVTTLEHVNPGAIHAGDWIV